MSLLWLRVAAILYALAGATALPAVLYGQPRLQRISLPAAVAGFFFHLVAVVELMVAAHHLVPLGWVEVQATLALLIVLLDLQGGEEHCQGLIGIPGSVRIDPRLLGRYKRQYRDVDLAMDREVILYCANQGERHSARVALALRRRGFERVRPLAGGLQAWRDCGFPVTRDIQMLPSPKHGVYVLREILHYSPTDSARALKTSVANIDLLMERAQERIGSSDDTHLPFLQHCHREDVAPQSEIPLPQDRSGRRV